MFQATGRVAGALAVLAALSLAPGVRAQSADDHDALAGMRDMKVAFDLHEGDAKALLARLNLIDETRQSLIRQGVTPHMVVAFRGPATTTMGVTGTLAVVWGAVGFFGAISTAVNYAWGVEKQRSFWKHKLFSFLMLLVAGLILLIALLLISASQVVGASWFAEVLQRFPGLGFLRGFTIRHATTLLFILVVGLVFYFVPNAKVRFRDVWVGAFLTGLLWKGALEGFAWYMRDMTRFTRVNGSIGAVVVFLVWVYLQAVILLYGVEFTAAYARLRRGRPEDVPAAATPRT